MLRDLDSLNRHSYEWSRTDKLRFLMQYLDASTVNNELRTLWKALVTLAERKNNKRA